MNTAEATTTRPPAELREVPPDPMTPNDAPVTATAAIPAGSVEALAAMLGRAPGWEVRRLDDGAHEANRERARAQTPPVVHCSTCQAELPGTFHVVRVGDPIGGGMAVSRLTLCDGCAASGRWKRVHPSWWWSIPCVWCGRDRQVIGLLDRRLRRGPTMSRWCTSECEQADRNARRRRPRAEHAATCARCGEEFTAHRRDARYCSTRCRVATHRAVHTAPAEAGAHHVPDAAVTVLPAQA